MPGKTFLKETSCRRIDSLEFTCVGGRFSLSPGERAGVRASVNHFSLEIRFGYHCRKYLFALCLLIFSTIPFLNAQTPPSSSSSSSNSTSVSERFDDLVREDFFAGMTGDMKAFDRGMTTCEAMLAKNPKHAQAMVWHGGGLLFRAGQVFQTNNIQLGLTLWRKGLKQMDDAVALEPDNISVLIPRGATLLPSSRYTPDKNESRRLLQTGVGDYEKVLKMQETYFTTLSTHSRGELLFGLADGWYRLGDTNKSRAYLQRILNDCTNSAYATRATSWLAADPKSLAEKSRNLTCIGCHSD